MRMIIWIAAVFLSERGGSEYIRRMYRICNKSKGKRGNSKIFGVREKGRIIIQRRKKALIMPVNGRSVGWQ